MFDASNLALFVAIVRAGSLSRAAIRLGMATTTVSRRLAELEESLGVRLLNRTTRSLGLTEAGRLYLEDTEPIVDAIEQANRAITRTRQEVEGRLRINAPQLIGEMLVMDWVLGFQGRYPRVEVDLDIDNHFIDLPTTGTDVAFRVGRLADSSLIARHLFDDRPRLVASHEYLARSTNLTHPKELQGLDAVITGTTQRAITWSLHRDGEECLVHPRGPLRVNDLCCAVQAVMAGRGIALLPALLVNPLLEQNKLQEACPAWSAPPAPIHLLYPSRRLLTRAQQAFIDFVCGRYELKNPLGPGETETAMA